MHPVMLPQELGVARTNISKRCWTIPTLSISIWRPSQALMGARLTALSKADRGVRGWLPALLQSNFRQSDAWCAPFTCCVEPRFSTLNVAGIGAHDHVSRAAMLGSLATLPIARRILPYARLSSANPSVYHWWDDDGNRRTISRQSRIQPPSAPKTSAAPITVRMVTTCFVFCNILIDGFIGWIFGLGCTRLSSASSSPKLSIMVSPPSVSASGSDDRSCGLAGLCLPSKKCSFLFVQSTFVCLHEPGVIWCLAFHFEFPPNGRTRSGTKQTQCPCCVMGLTTIRGRLTSACQDLMVTSLPSASGHKQTPTFVPHNRLASPRILHSSFRVPQPRAAGCPAGITVLHAAVSIPSVICLHFLSDLTPTAWPTDSTAVTRQLVAHPTVLSISAMTHFGHDPLWPRGWWVWCGVVWLVCVSLPLPPSSDFFFLASTFLCLTVHIATALHLFSACTLDVTSTVMTRMHVRSSMCAHSPSSGSSVNESCAQDTEQKHGKHGSGAPLSSFPLILAVVLAEHGGRLSSVDRDRELRIWSEHGARRNECETRCWLTLERVRNSLLESFRSRRFPLLAGLDVKVTIWIDPLTLNPWLWRANRLDHNGRCSSSIANSSECVDGSKRCTRSSVPTSTEHRTRSC